MPKTRARRCGLKPDSRDPARRPESDPRNRASYHFDDTGGRRSASRRCPGAPPVPLFRGTVRRAISCSSSGGKLTLPYRPVAALQLRRVPRPRLRGRQWADSRQPHRSHRKLPESTAWNGVEPLFCSPARSETLSRLEVLQVKEASRIHLLTVSAPRQAADEHLGEPLRGSRRATCFQAGRLIAASRVLASYDAD